MYIQSIVGKMPEIKNKNQGCHLGLKPVTADYAQWTFDVTSELTLYLFAV